MDERLNALATDFDLLDGWEDRYSHVIELGRAVPPLSDEARNNAALVPGCVSRVWLLSHYDDATGLIHFQGQSDAAIVQGLLAVLLALYSDRTPEEILSLDGSEAIARLGFAQALTPQRANGLHAMMGRIKAFATQMAN